MDRSNVAEVLRALASGDKARSETARLRDVFEEVEGALQAGVSRSAILETLQGQGFTMGLKGFESALYRIRKSRAKGNVKGKQMQPEVKVTAERSASVSDSAGIMPVNAESESIGAAGKTRTQAVLDSDMPSFSFKQMQQNAKDKK